MRRPPEGRTALGELEWTSHFEVGVDSLDHDHREMVGLINAFGASCADDSTVEQQRILDTLLRVAERHFAAEETFLVENNLPNRVHAEEHRSCLVTLTRLRLDALRDSSFEACRRGYLELCDWFIQHAVGLDSDIRARFYERSI